MKKQTVLKTKKFFEYLTTLSNVYFLSDEVEDIGLFIPGSITASEHAVLVATRDRLQVECEAQGLDIHTISIDVAEEFIQNNI